MAAPVRACVSGLQPSAFWPHWPAYTSGDIIGWLLKGYALFVPGVAVPLLVLVAGRARHADPKLWTIGPPRAVWEGLSAALPASPSGLTAASLLPPFLRSLPYGAPPKPAERPPRHRFSRSHKSEAFNVVIGLFGLDPDTQILYAYGQFFRSAASFYPTKPGAAPLHLRY